MSVNRTESAAATTFPFITESSFTSIWLDSFGPHDKTVDWVYGILTLIICFVTALGDVFLMIYFSTKKRKPSTLIYFCLLLADLILCITGTFIAVDMILYKTTSYKVKDLKNDEIREIVIDAMSVRYNLGRQINSYVYAVASRMCAMVNCYISVVRAIVILLPFTRINRWALFGSLAGYLMVVSVMMASPFKHTNSELDVEKANRWFCSHNTIVCEPEMFEDMSAIVDVFILVVIPYVLPCLPVLVCCTMIVIKQQRDTQFGDSMKQGTITVVYVSLLFIVCNSAYLVFSFIEFDYFYSAISNPDYHDMAKIYGLRTFVKFANSFGNAAILLMRSRDVKEFGKKLLTFHPFRRKTLHPTANAEAGSVADTTCRVLQNTLVSDTCV